MRYQKRYDDPAWVKLHSEHEEHVRRQMTSGGLGLSFRQVVFFLLLIILAVILFPNLVGLG